MHVTLDCSALGSALAHCARLDAKNAVVRLEAAGDIVTVVQTARGACLRIIIPAQVQRPGEILLHLDEAHRLVRSLRGFSFVEVEAADAHVRVAAGRTEARLSVADLSLVLPEILAPPVPLAIFADEASRDLAGMLDQAYPCASTDDARTGLSSVLVEVVDPSGRLADLADPAAGTLVRAAATDGACLLYTQMPARRVARAVPSFLVPRPMAAILAKLLADRRGGETWSAAAASFRGGAPVVWTSAEGWQLVHESELTDYFPGYRQVLPKSVRRRVRVAVAPLLEAVERCSAFASGRDPGVDIVGEDSTLLLTVERVGERLEETVACQGDGVERMQFSVTLLKRLLKSTALSEIELHFAGGSLDPLTWACDVHGGLCVLMPRRVD